MVKLSKHVLNMLSYHFASKLWTTNSINLGFKNVTSSWGDQMMTKIGMHCVLSTNKPLSNLMPWHYCVSTIINFTRAKLECWNTTVRTTTLDTFYLVELICPSLGAQNMFTHVFHTTHNVIQYKATLLRHVTYKCYKCNYDFDGKT